MAKCLGAYTQETETPGSSLKTSDIIICQPVSNNPQDFENDLKLAIGVDNAQNTYLRLKKETWKIRKNVMKLKKIKSEKKKLLKNLTTEIKTLKNTIDEKECCIMKNTVEFQKEYRKKNSRTLAQLDSICISVNSYILYDEEGNECNHSPECECNCI